jgi:DNA polymerase III delta prime subunit
MNNLLINKYKPKNINEMILEKNFINFMHKLITTETMNLIIVGNSSSGKTTLIKLIIEEYYKENNYEGNVLYIHGTKDQGIQYYRNELQIFCKTCSTIRKKKKMIIMDDFDLINDQSQQVFRNVMDNYSNSVLFIMTCINPHKIINSIQSRQLILTIPISNLEQLVSKCKFIIHEENIKIDENVLKHIIHISNYSIIRIINYLQKIKLIDEEITMSNISNIVTHINFDEFNNYFKLIQQRDFYTAISILNNLIKNGYSVIDILDSIYLYLKQSVNSNLSEKSKYLIIKTISKYITIFYNIHEDDIELVFFTSNVFTILQ